VVRSSNGVVAFVTYNGVVAAAEMGESSEMREMSEMSEMSEMHA
jgi:hypothetical protein